MGKHDSFHSSRISNVVGKKPAFAFYELKIADIASDL